MFNLTFSVYLYIRCMCILEITINIRKINYILLECFIINIAVLSIKIKCLLTSARYAFKDSPVC